MSTTTNKYLVHPVLAAGPTVASATAAWTWTTTAVEIVAASAITATFYISALTTFMDPTTGTVDVKYGTNFDLMTGSGGSEVSIAQFTVTHMKDSAVGYPPVCYLVLPEPKQVAANTRISIKAADSHTAAMTYGPVKIQYEIA